MDLQVLNVELFKKLSLAMAIIRNTPSGIPSDVFTRSLARRLFPRLNQSISIVDEHLILRQRDLLSRLAPLPSTMTASISLMDITSIPNDSNRKFTNEYEFGEFAEKVGKLKEKKYRLKIDEIEFLLNTIMKWITSTDAEHQTLPIDACLYTIQLVANHLKTDNDKPYHIVLDLLPIMERFLDGILDLMEQTSESHVWYLHQMVVSLASSNSCISRILDKLSLRLRQLCENPDILDDYDRQFVSSISPIDPLDRLFNILHEIIHNRSIFQSRLSQRSIDKLFTLIHQISPLLDGKSHHTHLLKLEGQFQAANYRRTGASMKTFRSYTSSSSSDHSQYPQQQKHYTNKAPPPSSKLNNLDYSMSQQSQNFLI